MSHFLRLQRAGVLHYWIFDPDDPVLIAYALEDGRCRTDFRASGQEETATRVRVPPFEEIEIDLGILFGDIP